VAQDPAELGLHAALQRAVAQHPLVEAARARVTAARGSRLTARALPNPVLSYWTENLGGPPRGAPNALDRETQVYATLPLEPLFQRWPGMRRADEDVRAADAELARARQMVALDAARAFHRVAAAQIAVDAAEEIRARLAELVTFSQARAEEGVAAEADLIRTRLELDRVAASVTLERIELGRARAELAPYLGEALTPFGNDSLRVMIEDTAAAGAEGGLRPLAELISRARVARPDLIVARARSAAARAEVGYQRTLTVRQIGATVGAKRTAGVTSVLLGVSLPIPLFDQNRGEVQRAVGERTAAEQEQAWAERQADAEVAAAYEAARLLSEQARRLRGSFLERAEESRRIALAAYQEGAVSLLQVLDASRTLADARLIYYRTIFTQRQSLLELQVAIGASPLERFPSSISSRSVRAPGDHP
jgi:cobalt-zinc-cadmium efflux system outer membrane protein